MDWAQGFRKTSHKARHGRKKATGVHRPHRKKLPAIYDRESRRERQRVIESLRADELGEVGEWPS